ncbi:hypothetical protein [Novosphingobium sp. TH158]|uniref:hypothetical protein n=1 Tax=Novosphingobium sp. TH158 TaxID=2067455 RepID=UPI000C7B14E4|nr:hypothetical protein [Novosphingobium sp. TH158]PLK27247.1 hypothetical protein C0V78_10375 [Novosphingobium sp. TH158]
MANLAAASLTIAELREFASFSACEQRYIKRSLDVGLGRQDAFKLWSRDAEESASIRSQYVAYQELKVLRCAIPDETGLDGVEDFMGKLIRVTAFDLAQGSLGCFSSYRFLYERLLGPEVRPWLPSAFCGAAALPRIHPSRRKMLLQSISEAAATAPGWSSRAPSFYPEWVDKEAA